MCQPVPTLAHGPGFFTRHRIEMDGTSGRPYHASLISMTSLTRLRTQALCFTFLGLAACSGDDNAAPAAGGSAGSGGSGGSSVAEAAAGDSTHPDVAVTPD